MSTNNQEVVKIGEDLAELSSNVNTTANVVSNENISIDDKSFNVNYTGDTYGIYLKSVIQFKSPNGNWKDLNSTNLNEAITTEGMSLSDKLDKIIPNRLFQVFGFNSNSKFKTFLNDTHISVSPNISDLFVNGIEFSNYLNGLKYIISTTNWLLGYKYYDIIISEHQVKQSNSQDAPLINTGDIEIEYFIPKCLLGHLVIQKESYHFKFALSFKRCYRFNPLKIKPNTYMVLQNYNKYNLIISEINGFSKSSIEYADINGFLWFKINTFDTIKNINVIINQGNEETEGNNYSLYGEQGLLSKNGTDVLQSIQNLNQENGAFLLYERTKSSILKVYTHTNSPKLESPPLINTKNATSIDEIANDFYFNKQSANKNNIYTVKCAIPSLNNTLSALTGATFKVYIEYESDENSSNLIQKNAFRAYSNSNCTLQYINRNYKLYSQYNASTDDDKIVAIYRLNEGETSFVGNISVFYGNQIIYGEKYNITGSAGDYDIDRVKINGEGYQKTSLYYTLTFENDLLYVRIHTNQIGDEKFNLNKIVSIYIDNYKSNVVTTDKFDSQHITQDTITLHSVDVSIPQFTKGNEIVLIDDYIHGKTKHYTNYTVFQDEDGSYTYYGLRAYAKRDGLNQRYLNSAIYDLGINGLTYNVNAHIVKLNLKKEQQNIYSFKSGSELVVFKKPSTGTYIYDENDTSKISFHELLNNTYSLSYEYIVDNIIPASNDDYNIRFYTTYAYAGKSAVGDFNKLSNETTRYSIEYTYTYQCPEYYSKMSITPNAIVNDVEENIYEYKYNDYAGSGRAIDPDNVYRQVVEYIKIASNSITLDQFKSAIAENVEQNPQENRYYKYSQSTNVYSPYTKADLAGLKQVPLNLYVKYIYYLKTTVDLTNGWNSSTNTTNNGEHRYFIDYNYVPFSGDVDVNKLLNSGKKYYQKIDNSYIPVEGFKKDGSIEYYGFRFVPITAVKDTVDAEDIVGKNVQNVINRPLNINGNYDIWVKQDFTPLKSDGINEDNLTITEVTEYKTKGIDLYLYDSGIEYLDVDKNGTIYDIDLSGDTIYSSDESLDSIISINTIRTTLNGLNYKSSELSKDSILKDVQSSPYSLLNFTVNGKKLNYHINLTGKYTKINYEAIEYVVGDGNIQYSKQRLFKQEPSLIKFNSVFTEEIFNDNSIIKRLLEYNVDDYLFIPLFGKLSVSNLKDSDYLQKVNIANDSFYHFRVINDKVYPVKVYPDVDESTGDKDNSKSGLIYQKIDDAMDIYPLYALDEDKLYIRTNNLHYCVNKQYFQKKNENVEHGKIEGKTNGNVSIDYLGTYSLLRYYGPTGGYNDVDIFTGKLDKDDIEWINTYVENNLDFSEDSSKLTGIYSQTIDGVTTYSKVYFHKAKLGPHITYVTESGNKIYHHNLDPTRFATYYNVPAVQTVYDSENETYSYASTYEFNFSTLSLYEYQPVYYNTSNEFINLSNINTLNSLGKSSICSPKKWKENIANGNNSYTDEILMKTKFFYSSYTFNDDIHIDSNGTYYTNIMVFDGNNGKVSKKMLLNNHTIDITKYSYEVVLDQSISLVMDESLNQLSPFDYDKYFITWNDNGSEKLSYLSVNTLSPAYYANESAYTLYTTIQTTYVYDYNNVGNNQLAYNGQPIVLKVNDNFYGIVFDNPIYKYETTKDGHKQKSIISYTYTLAITKDDSTFNSMVDDEDEIIGFVDFAEHNEENEPNRYYKKSFDLPLTGNEEFEDSDISLFNDANNELYYNYNNLTNDSIKKLYSLQTYWDPSDYLYEVVELTKFAFKGFDSDNTVIQYKDVSTYSIETSKPFTITNGEQVKFTGTYSWIPPEFETKVLEDGTSYTVITRDGYYKRDYIIEDKPLTVASYNYYPANEISSINVTYNYVPYSYVVTAEINHPKISYNYLVNDLKEEVKYSYLLNGFEYDYDINDGITYEDNTYYGMIHLSDIDGTFTDIKVNLYKRNTIVSTTSVKEITEQEPYTSYEYFAYKESTPLSNEKRPVLYKTELIPASKRKVQYWNSNKGSYSIKSVLESYAYYAYYYTYETVPFQVASYVYLDELNIVGFNSLTDTVKEIGDGISYEVDKQSQSFDKMTTDLSYIFNNLVSQEKELADEESYILSTYATSIDNSLKDFAYNSNNTLSEFSYKLGTKITYLTETEKNTITSLETNIVEQLTESNNITKTGLNELSDIVKGKLESIELTVHSDLIGEKSSEEIETKYIATTYTPIINPVSGLIMGYTYNTSEGSDTIKVGGDSLGEIIQSTLGTTTTRTVRTDNANGSYTLATYTGFTGLANILGNLTISNRIPQYNEFMVDLVPKMYAAIDFEGDYDIVYDVNGNVKSKTKRNPSDMAKKCIMRADTLWTELKKKGIVS